MNEIRLVFHREDAIDASYLYYFFQWCGVLCSKYILDTGEKWNAPDHEGDSKITILIEKNCDRVCDCEASANNPGVVFFGANDVYEDLGKDKTSQGAELVDAIKKIARLTEKKNDNRNDNRNDNKDLVQLAKLYGKYDLWNLLWVYHEVPWQENLEKAKILSSYNWIERAIRESGCIQGVHGKYASVFLKYIKVDLGRRQQWQADKVCYALFVKSYELVETVPDFWSAHILCGKICELGNAYEKLASIYYRRAAVLSQNSDLLYCAGRKMEHEGKPEDDYMDYYKRAYENNHKNYRALFKLAYKLERDGEYEAALDEYGYAVNYLYDGAKCGYTDVLEYIYLFKSLKRIARIYGQRSSSSEISRKYIEDSERVRANAKKDPYFCFMCTNQLLTTEEFSKCTDKWLYQLMER